MAGQRDFWVSLQLGKWRSEVTQKIFSARLSALFVSTALAYFGITIYFLILPHYLPGFSNMDFLTPISAMFGFFVAIIGIKFGFEGYFVQQRAKPEVLTYLGMIEYQGVKSLITFINKGDTVVIRNISLLAVKDRKSIGAFLFSGIPTIEIFQSVTISHGWRILKEGESAGVLEQDIKRAIREIESRIGNEKEQNNLHISMMAFDEEFDITKRQSLGETLLAGCKLGNCTELINYAKKEKEGFPGLVSGTKAYIGISSTSEEKLAHGEMVKVELVGEVPPNVVDVNAEIWIKLDCIEKLLSKIVKEDESRKGKQEDKAS